MSGEAIRHELRRIAIREAAGTHWKRQAQAMRVGADAARTRAERKATDAARIVLLEARDDLLERADRYQRYAEFERIHVMDMRRRLRERTAKLSG